MIRVLKVWESGAGKRLDRWLAEECAATDLKGLTRSRIKALCEAGAVRVNAQVARAATLLRPGDVVEIVVPDDLLPKDKITPEPFTLPVLYEDEALLVIDKPAGMVVHPAAGHLKGTVVHQLLARGPFSTVGGAERPGIVHRLDEGTSGVLVIAKTDEVHRNLIEQFKSRAVEKIYIALVHGVVTEDEGRIEGPIGRDPADRQRMRILSSGRPAITEFRVRKRLPQETLLEVRPLTGRTHQIRVHLRAIGHPVVGDPLYGSQKKKSNVGRMMLHAWQLSIAHPVTGERLRLIAPPPPEFLRLAPELLQSDPTVIEQRQIRQPNPPVEHIQGELAPEEESQDPQGDQGRGGLAKEARLDDDPAPVCQTEHQRPHDQETLRDEKENQRVRREIAAEGQRDEEAEKEGFIGQGIQNLAQRADLTEGARQGPIEQIPHKQEHQQPIEQLPRTVKEEIEQWGNPEQTQQRDEIGKGHRV